jgi:hypothetical protein
MQFKHYTLSVFDTSTEEEMNRFLRANKIVDFEHSGWDEVPPRPNNLPEQLIDTKRWSKFLPTTFDFIKSHTQVHPYRLFCNM